MDAEQAKAEQKPRKAGFFATVFASPPSILTLMVPGLGHLYLGRAKRGVLWFLLVEALFFAGYAILGVRLWGGGMNLGTTVWGLPLNYIPEVGNFLTTFLTLKATFPLHGAPGWMDAVGLAKLPVPWEHVGFLLTALSGILNVFAAADAWWLARVEKTEREKDPWLSTPTGAAFLSWLVPGLGQWKLGYKSRGAVQFGSITLLFLLGLVFSDFTAVDRSQVYFWYAGMLFDGGSTILSTLFFAPLRFHNTGSTMWDLGVTTTCIAGLMNVAVLLDAYTLAEKKKEAAP